MPPRTELDSSENFTLFTAAWRNAVSGGNFFLGLNCAGQSVVTSIGSEYGDLVPSDMIPAIMTL